MQKKFLNLKNMKETIVNYSGDQKEFDKIWDAFYQMACIGFISQDTWTKFFDQCAGWYVDEENACVRDDRQCPGGLILSSGSTRRMRNTELKNKAENAASQL